MSLVVGPFDAGDQRQARQARQGVRRNHLVVVGDGQEVQPVPQGVLRQFLDAQDAVRGQRVGVQVALEQAQALWGEGQLVA